MSRRPIWAACRNVAIVRSSLRPARPAKSSTLMRASRRSGASRTNRSSAATQSVSADCRRTANSDCASLMVGCLALTWRATVPVQADWSDKLPHASEALFLNPVCQQRCQFARPFQWRHVAAIFEDGEARMGQVLRHAFGLGEAAQPVLAAGDNQGRAGDAFEVGITVEADQCGLPLAHLAAQPALHAAQ